MVTFKRKQQRAVFDSFYATIIEIWELKHCSPEISVKYRKNYPNEDFFP